MPFLKTLPRCRVLHVFPEFCSVNVNDATLWNCFNNIMLSRRFFDIYCICVSIAVYINHRPVFGLNPALLERAFDMLGELNEEGISSVDRGHFLYLLQNKGK